MSIDDANILYRKFKKNFNNKINIQFIMGEIGPYEVLAITSWLVPAITAIWLIFLQRDLSEKVAEFKMRLKKYGEDESRKILARIQKILKEEKDTSKALETLTNYFDDWSLKSEAISLLMKKEDDIYNIGKSMLFLLILVFGAGIYASLNPTESFWFFSVSRVSVLYWLFLILIFIVVLWFWKIFDFGKELNRVYYGGLSEMEDIILKYIEKVKKERGKKS